ITCTLESRNVCLHRTRSVYSISSILLVSYLFYFFFSSRRRHTRSVSAFLLNRSSDLFCVSKNVSVSCAYTQGKREQFSGFNRTLDAINNVFRKFSAFHDETGRLNVDGMNIISNDGSNKL